MSRSLDDICEIPRDRFIELIARCAERKVFLFPLDTLRTLPEQETNMATGASDTLDSWHLPQDGCGLSHAADFAIVNRAGEDERHGRKQGKTIEFEWRDEDIRWVVLQEEADDLDLRAGLLRKDGVTRYDLGHVAWEVRHRQTHARLSSSGSPSASDGGS